MKHIVHIVGARPNFMKLAPLWRALRGEDWCRQVVIHTGQHFSPVMSEEIFRDLGLPEPDVNLAVEGGNYLEQIAVIIRKLSVELPKHKPDVVIVYGDVNSTLAGAMAAKALGLPVAHVEAGLRSRDIGMPEERNRVFTDHITDHFFITSDDARANLVAEGIGENNIHLVGNMMVDSLLVAQKKAAATTASPDVAALMASDADFALLTLHRPANVDEVEHLRELFATLGEVAEQIPIVFPVHPRTQAMMRDLSLPGIVPFGGSVVRGHIHMLPPLSYLDFIRLEERAKFVLSDSGGIQEETSVLGVPCLTLRENTERPVTVTYGTNTIVGTDRQTIMKHVEEILNGRYKKGKDIPFWDGEAGERIAAKLREILH